MTEYGQVLAHHHYLQGTPDLEDRCPGLWQCVPLDAWPPDTLLLVQADMLGASAQYGFDPAKAELTSVAWQDHFGDWHAKYGWYCDDGEPHGPVEP